jgi:predicted oxidoreductase
MERSYRLSLIFEKLNEAHLPTNFDEAWTLLHATMNSVEDALSGVPYNPDNWRVDGRLYPPALDREQECELESVRKFHSRGHEILIARNGAIKIVSRRNPDDTPLDKPGSDGKRCPE